MKRTTKDLLDQIQVVCTGYQTINLMVLQYKMWTMLVTKDTISQYIVAFEKA